MKKKERPPAACPQRKERRSNPSPSAPYETSFGLKTSGEELTRGHITISGKLRLEGSSQSGKSKEKKCHIPSLKGREKRLPIRKGKVQVCRTIPDEKAPLCKESWGEILPKSLYGGWAAGKNSDGGGPFSSKIVAHGTRLNCLQNSKRGTERHSFDKKPV